MNKICIYDLCVRAGERAEKGGGEVLQEAGEMWDLFWFCFVFFSLIDSPQSNVIPLTEQNWSDVTQVDGYSKSKTLAEKAAWVFVKDLPGTSRASVVQISVPLHAYSSLQ